MTSPHLRTQELPQYNTRHSSNLGNSKGPRSLYQELESKTKYKFLIISQYRRDPLLSYCQQGPGTTVDNQLSNNSYDNCLHLSFTRDLSPGSDLEMKGNLSKTIPAHLDGVG
jgi:hypothetical protein